MSKMVKNLKMKIQRHCIRNSTFWLNWSKESCKVLPSLGIYRSRLGGKRGHDCNVVGFTTICAISAYHHFQLHRCLNRERARLECSRLWVRGPGRVKPKTMNLVFVASPLNTQHYGERAKMGWLGIRIMCLIGATCLSTDSCFSELSMLV
jgi:hypothetical protein